MDLSATLAATGDDPVEFSFTVTNRSDAAVELTFPTSQRGDVRVLPHDADEPVWEWSDGRMFAQALEEQTLAGGEDLELSFEWESPPPGRYRAIARLTADHDASARTQFTV